MAFATWIKQHSRVGSAMAAVMSGTAASVGGAGAGPGGGSAALGGLGGSLEDKDCELLCPVCFELINEAYVTRCGHSFCYACIAKSVELQRRCPKCGAALASREHIFPNFLLNELVARRKLRARPAPPTGEAAEGVRLRALVAAEARHLGLAEVDGMLDVLTRRKRLLQAESAAAQHRLLYEFLSQLLRLRHHQLDQLVREATLVRSDLDQVGRVLRELKAGAPESERPLSPHALDHASEQQDCAEERRAEEEEESFAGGPGGAAGGDAVAARWRRLTTHFDDFVQCYLAHRADELYFPGSSSATPTPGLGLVPPAPPAAPSGPAPTHAPTSAPTSAPSSAANEGDAVPQQMSFESRAASAAGQRRVETGCLRERVVCGRCGRGRGGGDQRAPEGGEAVTAASGAGSGVGGAGAGAVEPCGGLEAFRADLAAFTRYRALRPLATLAYCSDAINYSTIVSTIEFDKDNEFFAIAGVTKRIKVFEFESVVRDAVDVHYPCAEMQCAHKVSCVSWNAYHKHVLASADYEGTVSVWDAAAGTRTRALQEHDKRCWSVHFNRTDVRLLASGSDDARVKLWALNTERSVATLEAKFNVCCVRFNPASSCHLAFGSADHCVHYYDLRAPRLPARLLQRRHQLLHHRVHHRVRQGQRVLRHRRRHQAHQGAWCAVWLCVYVYVFEFESVVRDAVDVHYPCAEMQCAHKVSCVSWNAYHKHVLASADYEGTVSVWDAAAGTRTRALQEHDKRCWSVHFNRTDVRLLASGSDDARVKLWALNTERSVATLEAKFNVCCVRFNPASSCHLAFGSADHCVHYYDLRAPRLPLAVFRDHRKAVSYVKFLDARTLLSASTDSQLKLWRVESPRCVRSFTGHANEKNFVGLATDGRYLACGSENNSLYVYYSGLSRPLLVYKFEALRGFLERERRDEEPSEFVSAVCWRAAPDRPALLAANSQGTIKVLELV
ncbi:E3 ubiquitin-protein ligase RFWD2 [Papilio xuthus]|uniref:E3 ubiquitin-protein ligase RFWD2 n=1 Tax=Papilio xuthus TaxID=66420 RepID=A0A194Q9M7_PAPXU|nr:E3 ubiquitin-protein ligase RFWD2 [Papilio xuthus]